MTTFERVKAICIAHLGCDDDKVTDIATFEDLGADSLDVFELVMAFEDDFSDPKTFNLTIEDDEATEADTVGKMVTLIDGKLAAK